jgi:colicin import membrane protein
MGIPFPRAVLAFAVSAMLTLPATALADVTPAPVVAPSTPTVSSTPVQSSTPSSSSTSSTSSTTSSATSAAALAAQKKAAALVAARKAAEAKAAKIAAAKARAAEQRRQKIEAARRKAALVAAQKKAAAEHARLVSQQQHAEDTAEATFAKALQRDDAFRFSTTAAQSIGASAAIEAVPMGAADPKAGSKVFATSPSSAPPIPLFAAIGAAIALAAASAYAVRSRAWRVVR